MTNAENIMINKTQFTNRKKYVEITGNQLTFT